MISLRMIGNIKYFFTGRGALMAFGVLFLSFTFSISCGTKNPVSSNEDDDREQVTLIEEPDGVDHYEGLAPEYTKINVFNRKLLFPGYNHFRIPAIVTTNQGTLLAFSEMRTGGDMDPKTLVYRRSTDNGESWGPVTLVEEQTTSKLYGNQNVVVDRNTGNVHLVYLQVFPGTGGNTCNMYHKVSTDDGLTWSDRKLMPNVVNARWRPLGPAAGIQLQRGEHAGRLLIPGRYNEGGQQGNYAIYSDDGGETWKLGYKSIFNSSIGLENEVTAVELAQVNGSESVVYVNSRNQASVNHVYRRLEAYSYDSGESLTGPFQQNEYIKTVKVQGDLFRWSAIDQGNSENRILFSAPSFAKENLSGGGPVRNKRRHVGIWSTFDETETWTPVAKQISDQTGSYTSITRTADGFIGILFEEGEAVAWDETSFVKINEAFLDVPLIGAEWSFEEQTPGAGISKGSTLSETYNGGTARNIEAVGSVSTTEGSKVFNQTTALEFDGSSYLKLSDIDTWTQFDFNENSSFTIELIIKAEEPDNSQFLVGRPYQTNWPQWLLKLEKDGTVSFRIDDDEDFAFIKTKASVTDNKWHHIAAVRDRDTKKLKIYIDGQLSNEVADEVEGSLGNRHPLLIGGLEGGGSNFIGEIDFVRISPKAINKFFE